MSNRSTRGRTHAICRTGVPKTLSLRVLKSRAKSNDETWGFGCSKTSYLWYRPEAWRQERITMNAAKRIKRVALYFGVHGSPDHQKSATRTEAAAERHRWEMVACSRTKASRCQGRDSAPARQAIAGGRQERVRYGCCMVRRSYRAIVDRSVGTLQELHSKHVDLYLHQQGIDTTTPSGKAMFQMMGVFAEFERSMLRERVNAGLARARAEGTQLGRPAEIASDEKKVRSMKAARAAGKSVRAIASEHGVGVGTVQRLTAA